ncbi:MAG: hypothetical protein OWQ59_12895 [Alicyclobacillaceae bacterium]|nr:hypothetical protein [Alicyclobacillaceae bacterium]
MASKSKIKIRDNTDLRIELETNTNLISQINLSKWAISVAKHVLSYLDREFPNNEKIEDGFNVIESWQKGEATVHQVRQAGFRVHEVARECKSETARAAARAVGQAVGVGHMKEHAMVAADYAIKVVGLDSQWDMNRITEEREWQLKELMPYIK